VEGSVLAVARERKNELRSGEIPKNGLPNGILIVEISIVG